jgi:hypothetical protein
MFKLRGAGWIVNSKSDRYYKVRDLLNSTVDNPAGFLEQGRGRRKTNWSRDTTNRNITAQKTVYTYIDMI